MAAYGERRNSTMHPSLSKKIVDQEIAQRIKDAERLRLSRTSGELVNALNAHVGRDLIDRLMELYCDWRAGCAEVQASYERFLSASSRERAVAFAAYSAALDREQSACESYAGQVRLIESLFHRAERRGAPARGRPA